MKEMLHRLVIIGNGMAGQAAVEEILQIQNDGYEIVVFGAEPSHSYNRIMLSDVLSGKRSFSQLNTKNRAWYESNRIKLFTRSPVTKIDAERKMVFTENGYSSHYDKLLLATGSVPFIPPIKGVDKNGVHVYRTIEDVWSMSEISRYRKNAVVIGGGLLGLEAAKALKDNGMDVTVIHLTEHLMEQQLDYDSGTMLQMLLEKTGLKFRMNAVTREILGEDSVTGVKLQSGEVIEADMLLICTGIRPNTELARNAEIMIRRGVVVNDFLETSHENIYAIGECVEHRGVVYGLFEPLAEQARVVADSLVGGGLRTFEESPLSAVLKIADINLVSVGNYAGGDDCEELVYSDPAVGIYKKIVLKENRIDGAIFLGDTTQYRDIYDLLRGNAVINGKRQNLLLGGG
ncbi:MAG: NAD(P)/FAD-dependent oxidoreductase [Candidatus Dadabacteria bacterium]|nr:NAD(P)/FAD-dependent oxidoreductase [Candidatus Dadabacteria bacterium]